MGWDGQRICRIWILFWEDLVDGGIDLDLPPYYLHAQAVLIWDRILARTNKGEKIRFELLSSIFNMSACMQIDQKFRSDS